MRPSLITSYSAPATISSDDCGLMSGSTGVEPAPSVFHLLFGSPGLIVRRRAGSTQGPAPPAGCGPEAQGIAGVAPIAFLAAGWLDETWGSEDSERSAASSGTLS